MIEGDPFKSNKGLGNSKKKQSSLVDYYLELDKNDNFTTRKFG